MGQQDLVEILVFAAGFLLAALQFAHPVVVLLLFGLWRHHTITRAQLLQKDVGAEMIAVISDSPCWKFDTRLCTCSNSTPGVATRLFLPATQEVDIFVIIIWTIKRHHNLKVSSEI